MAFETFPLPDSGSRIGKLNDAIAKQSSQLMPILTKLYGSLDGALNQQQIALNGVGKKLTRALNGRIKAQAGAISTVIGSAIGALGDRIAAQGSALATQSAVLSRLAPAGAAPLLPASPGGGSLPPPINPGGAGQPQTGASGAAGPALPAVPGGARGGTSVAGSIPSLPPGVSAPPFNLAPAEILPQPPAQPPLSQPSPGAGNVFDWACLVDCAARTIDVYNLDDPNMLALIAAGAYVPVRYAHNVHQDMQSDYGAQELKEGWLIDNAERLAGWIDVACAARNGRGAGWPPNGDFAHNAPVSSPHNGVPVGDWPFDSQGNYIGI